MFIKLSTFRRINTEISTREQMFCSNLFIKGIFSLNIFLKPSKLEKIEIKFKKPLILLKNDLNFAFQKWDWFIKQQLSILLINNLINLFMSQLQYKPFHTVHGVLKARILKWFAIPFSSGPCFVRPRHYFAEKGLSSQSYSFSSSHVRMWELDHKESWAPKNWCFWTVILE